MTESDQSSDKKNNSGNDSPAAQYVPRSAILDGVFFTAVHVDSDGVKVKAICNNCTTQTIIYGSSNVLSNFTIRSKVGLTVQRNTSPLYRGAASVHRTCGRALCHGVKIFNRLVVDNLNITAVKSR